MPNTSSTAGAPSLLSKVTSYFKGSQAAPLSTAEIQDVHKQLAEWRSERPRTLEPHLREMLSQHIVDVTEKSRHCIEIADKCRARSGAIPTNMTYSQLLSALDPDTQNQPVPCSHDVRTSWEEHKSRHDKFQRIVDAYSGSRSALSIAASGAHTTQLNTILKEYNEVTGDEWIEKWLTRLNSLTMSVLEGAKKNVSSGRRD